MKKKKKLDEGLILLAPLRPVATFNNLKLSNHGPDNFVFKGLPGQFDENGNKVLDEHGEPINEFLENEVINEDSYHSGEIDKFIKKNDTGSEYFPTVKFFGEKGDTKHLSVTYEALRKISKIFKSMKIKSKN